MISGAPKVSQKRKLKRPPANDPKSRPPEPPSGGAKDKPARKGFSETAFNGELTSFWKEKRKILGKKKDLTISEGKRKLEPGRRRKDSEQDAADEVIALRERSEEEKRDEHLGGDSTHNPFVALEPDYEAIPKTIRINHK